MIIDHVQLHRCRPGVHLGRSTSDHNGSLIASWHPNHFFLYPKKYQTSYHEHYLLAWLLIFAMISTSSGEFHSSLFRWENPILAEIRMNLSSLRFQTWTKFSLFFYLALHVTCGSLFTYVRKDLDFRKRMKLCFILSTDFMKNLFNVKANFYCLYLFLMVIQTLRWMNHLKACRVYT